MEEDTAAAMRDGIKLYCDVFRPAGNEKVPAIIGWSPYGKIHRFQNLDMFPGRMGIPRKWLSNLQAWEAPDPAYWCNQGYAVVNVDIRGAINSEGNIHFWGTQDAEDGYDFIEWLATQSWCNGKIGMSGNSWLAISQWFIASAQPPHLACIAPWEGMTDLYRYDICQGGMPDSTFNSIILSHFSGHNYAEDIPAMLRKYPLMNAYWEDKAARLGRIKVPAYVTASYTSMLHTQGTFEGFRKISSVQKWLRVHNTNEWYDYYSAESVEDLRRFYDHYLKGMDNGWEKTPRVRLSVLDPGGKDLAGREEKEFPPARTENLRLYLDAAGGNLVNMIPGESSSISYISDDGKGQAVFTMEFQRETELTGYMKLRLWVEAGGSDDMDLFLSIRKLDGKGEGLAHMTVRFDEAMTRQFKELFSKGDGRAGVMFYSGPSTRIRVSHRSTDPARSSKAEPYLSHSMEDRLSPGRVVPVDILFPPASILYHPGEQICIVISGHRLSDSSAFVGGSSGAELRNRGEHIIHAGGKYDSHLMVPVIHNQ